MMSAPMGAELNWTVFSRIQVILWEALFVVVDDGKGTVSDYDVLRKMVVEQSSRHPGGLGCLAVITANAKPPSDEVRASLNKTLEVVPLKCICWQVEGAGFQAAMVRAVLSGLRFFKRQSYPTHISTDLVEAVGWMLPHLEAGTVGRERIQLAVTHIRNERARGRFAEPP
jgi:hypothetical protein